VAKLFLLDGNSLAYRAFFALPTDMATASGQVTNAVFGFNSMLTLLLREYQPDGIAVAFDRPEPTFRHAMVDDYKGGRNAAPDILRQQMGLVRQLVDTMKIPALELAGYEADDIIATLATQARDRGDDVVIVTGDRDAYQLVEDPHVRVLYVKRGVADLADYDEAGIEARTGVRPEKYAEYAALRGDPSDNLPGVPGVGEKTAAKLINTYGDLDGVFAHVDEATPKLRENLIAHQAQVRSNALAIPLVRDVPIDCDVESLKMGGWDLTELRDLYNFLEFSNAVWDRLMEAMGETGGPATEATPDTTPLEVEVRHLDDVDEAVTLINELGAATDDPISVAAGWEGLEGRSTILGLALVAEVDVAYWLPAELFAQGDVRQALSHLFGGGGRPLRAHRAKELMRGLKKIDIDVRCLDLDTAVAAYLVDPAGTEYPLDKLAARYAGIDSRPPDAPPPDQLDFDGVGPVTADAAGREAAAVARLSEPLSAALDARGLRKLWDEIERPLVRVLARMEAVGIRADSQYLAGLTKSLTDEVRELEAEIQEIAGEPFKVNSTPQLRHILFDKLGLQPQKKTKTGFSTDAASLEKLAGQHPIIEKLLRYREVEKLRSTYGESLIAEIADDGRIHATFHQTVARTGRLSSDQPNLHNIPIRSEEGRQFRRAFIPAEGHTFLVADYNQIELRVIAHLSQDPGLVSAFTSGEDIHSTTASRIYGVEAKDVTLAQRSKAKMVSYGLAYGMESFGLAQRLGIPVDEAAEILKAYFVAFPNVKAYMEATVDEARSRGYTETLFGRRRQIPELSSSNYRIRQAGERQAMNAGIQGLAADIFKVALVRLDETLESEGLSTRLILQVHDEVILEVPPDEKDRAVEATLEAMSGAADLSVPLEVNVSWGDSWADAKG
jgi:DNA polymerase-1